jgi:hypothetical protein
MTPKFNYVNGVCGSGKTYTAITNIAERVKAGETIIYTTETIKLLKQTQIGLEALGIDCYLITSQESIDWKSHYNSAINDIKQACESPSSLQDNITIIHKKHNANFNNLNLLEVSDWKKQYKSVVVEIVNSITHNLVRPCVILCTTKSLIRSATSLPSTVKLPLFIDEGFVVAEAGEFISATSTEIQGVEAKLKLIDKAPDEYSTDKRYQLPEKLKPLEQYITNNLYDIQYDTSKAKLNWVASLKVKVLASCFSEVTLLAACHEDTLQYHAIQAAGCQQIPLDWGLATEHYSNGTIHIYWVLQDNEWRSYFKDKLEDERLEDIAHAFGLKHWSNETLSVKGIGGEGVALPVKSHGFNDASDNNNLLNLHTQMPSLYLNKFYKEHYGMTNPQIRTAYYHYDCYQAAMRVSLRNSTKDIPRTEDNYFCFGDKATAKYFMSKLAQTVKVEQEKLILQRRDEATLTWVAYEIEVKIERSDKVSNGKPEQKNRLKDKEKLLKLSPSLTQENLEALQLLIRDWRRDNKNKRMTPKLYKQFLDTSAS